MKQWSLHKAFVMDKFRPYLPRGLLHTLKSGCHSLSDSTKLNLWVLFFCKKTRSPGAHVLGLGISTSGSRWLNRRVATKGRWQQCRVCPACRIKPWALRLRISTSLMLSPHWLRVQELAEGPHAAFVEAAEPAPVTGEDFTVEESAEGMRIQTICH